MADETAAAASFNVRDAKRIGVAVRDHERRFGNTPIAGSRGPAIAMYGMMRTKCTTAIPEGTVDDPSDTGRVQVYHRGPSGVWAPSGEPQQVFCDHSFGDDVEVGAAVKVAWIGGQLWFVQGDCEGE